MVPAWLQIKRSLICYCALMCSFVVYDSARDRSVGEWNIGHRLSTARRQCQFFRQVSKPLNRRNNSTLRWDINLNHYPSRAGSHAFVACVYPKVGSSQWVSLLHFLRTGKRLGNMGLRIHEQKDREYTAVDVGRVGGADLLSNPKIPKVLITRNPYDRVVSSYFDMKRRDNRGLDFTFETFVYRYLLHGDTNTTQPSDHRAPITSGCNVWNTTTYHYTTQWNYILKLEEMPLWISCLLNDLKLESVAFHGWPTSTGGLFDRGMSLDTTLASSFGQLLRLERWPLIQTYKVGHERPMSKWIDMYSPELVRVVNHVYASDFIVGGYSLWDGVAGTERFH